MVRVESWSREVEMGRFVVAVVMVALAGCGGVPSPYDWDCSYDGGQAGSAACNRVASGDHERAPCDPHPVPGEIVCQDAVAAGSECVCGPSANDGRFCCLRLDPTTGRWTEVDPETVPTR